MPSLFFRLRQYLPENALLDAKQRTPLRVCREELALLQNDTDATVLACRASHLEIGAPFFKALDVPAADAEFFLRYRGTYPRMLLRSARGAVLIFNDHLSEVGISLAILPQLPAELALRALTLCGELSFVPAPDASPSPAEPPTVALRQACEQLGELLGLLRGTLCRSEISCFRQHVQGLATLAGCRTELAKDEPLPLPIGAGELARLSSFLLCLLLHLRRQNATLLSDEAPTAEAGEAPLFRLRFLAPTPLCFSDAREELLASLADPAPTPLSIDPADPTLRFLTLPAFRDYTLSRSGELLFLDALLDSYRSPIPQPSSSLPFRSFLALEILRRA